MKPKDYPKITMAIIILSLFWILISFFQWGLAHYDLSQLIFGLAIGLGGLYIAYDSWYKIKNDEEHKELEQMCDSLLNFKLEVEHNNKNQLNKQMEVQTNGNTTRT